MPIRIRFIAPIARDVRSLITRLCRGLEKVTPVPHRLTVHVAPAPVIKTTGIPPAFGAFVVPCEESGLSNPAIWMAGEKVPEPKATDAERLELIGETLAHEIGHYEQWRDGRKMTERGVNVRARSLLNSARLA